jgi:hypothetical protein
MEQPDIQDSEIIESPDEDVIESESIETDETDQESEQSDEPEDDSEEVEYEGEKFKVPAKLKDALLRQADYTRKTQEVAEVRRQAEAERQLFEQQKQFHFANMQEVARVIAIDQQLQQYAAINWDQLENSDPVQAMKLQRQFRELQAQKAQSESTVAQRHQAMQQAQQQEAAMRLNEGQRVLTREIPGWGPELALKLKEFGLKEGMSAKKINSMDDPSDVLNLYAKYQLSEMKAKATKKPQQVQTKPVTKIQAVKATANRDSEKIIFYT